MPAIRNNKFVVVGGASLLGSNIGWQLLAGGAREVILMDNLSLGSATAIEDLVTADRCTFLRGDMLRINELFDPFEGAAGVFNVAGFLAGPMLANPWMGLDVNVRGIQNVLEAARVRGVSKVVFSSSIGVYGKIGDEPNVEDMGFDWAGLGPALNTLFRIQDRGRRAVPPVQPGTRAGLCRAALQQSLRREPA